MFCDTWTNIDETLKIYKPDLIFHLNINDPIPKELIERYPQIIFFTLPPKTFIKDFDILKNFILSAIDQSSVPKNIFQNFIGETNVIRELKTRILKVSNQPFPVCICGENGTGKEVVARIVHKLSSRSSFHFVPVNCGSIPEQLMDSELFGCEKGAYTDAIERKGFIQESDGGSLFLDEISELSLDKQSKFLRLLETKDYYKVGSSEASKAEFRLITATNEDLKNLVLLKKFRTDLFHRIYVVPLEIPPLRERKEDIPILIEYFFDQKAFGSRTNITTAGMQKLMNYDWPGNVRELFHCLERALIFQEFKELQANDFEFYGI